MQLYLSKDNQPSYARRAPKGYKASSRSIRAERATLITAESEGQIQYTRQISDGPLYTLDLGKCYDFLTRLGERIGEQTETGVRNFIDHLLLSVNVSGWQDYVTDCASTTDVLVSIT